MDFSVWRRVELFKDQRLNTRRMFSHPLFEVVLVAVYESACESPMTVQTGVECVCACVYVCVRTRMCVCVCAHVCVCERERERGIERM